MVTDSCAGLREVSIWLGSQTTLRCGEGTHSAMCSYVRDLHEVPCSSNKVLRNFLGGGGINKSLILGPVKSDANKHKPSVNAWLGRGQFFISIISQCGALHYSI